MDPISLDLTIERVLADPMIAAVMRADRIEPHDLADLLRSAARRFGGMRHAEPGARAATTTGTQIVDAWRGRHGPSEPCLACA